MNCDRLGYALIDRNNDFLCGPHYIFVSQVKKYNHTARPVYQLLINLHFAFTYVKKVVFFINHSIL